MGDVLANERRSHLIVGDVLRNEGHFHLIVWRLVVIVDWPVGEFTSMNKKEIINPSSFPLKPKKHEMMSLTQMKISPDSRQI